MLPEGLTPPSTEELEGRRLPADPVPEDPAGSWIEFASDNTWQGSDGCNGYGGLWLLSSNGQIRSTSGPSTLMACPGVNLRSWLVEARVLGLDEVGDLVVIDVLNSESGRLVREGAQS